MVFNLRTFSFTSSVDTSSVEGDATPPKVFSLMELRVATHNFSSNNIVGHDWCSKVYRGRLADGSLVAVKSTSSANPWGEELFEAQVQVGTTISTHPNVICLRGFCRTKEELLLVYPLMINNSLYYNLRERPDRFAQPLNWTTRKRIALGVAKGLAHLHNQGNIKIMHRNICPSNILLDTRFEAVIGGFSIAMITHERNTEEGTIEWATCMPRRGTGVSISLPVEENSADPGSDSHSCYHYRDVYVNTRICGTVGFVAPEYIHTRKCTLKNDVFAYGTMLLELISGQPSYLEDDGISCLKDWAEKHMNEEQLTRVIDPNLQGNYVEEEAEQLVRLALLCAHEDASVRPEMTKVVRLLESQFLQRNPSTRSSWSQSECDSTPYHSFPPSPSPSPLGIVP